MVRLQLESIILKTCAPWHEGCPQRDKDVQVWGGESWGMLICGLVFCGLCAICALLDKDNRDKVGIPVAMFIEALDSSRNH